VQLVENQTGSEEEAAPAHVAIDMGDLAAAMYPEVRPAMGHMNWHATAFRMRQLFGHAMALSMCGWVI
jgi:hypothetical protein